MINEPERQSAAEVMGTCDRGYIPNHHPRGHLRRPTCKNWKPLGPEAPVRMINLSADPEQAQLMVERLAEEVAAKRPPPDQWKPRLSVHQFYLSDLPRFVAGIRQNAIFNADGSYVGIIVDGDKADLIVAAVNEREEMVLALTDLLNAGRPGSVERREAVERARTVLKKAREG